MAWRGRQVADEVELEELVIEGETPEPGDLEVAPPRRRAVAVAGLVLAALVAVSAVGRDADGVDGPPLATRTTVEARSADFAILARYERDAFLGLRRSSAFEVEVDRELGAVEQVLARQGAVAAALGGGTARWWSQRAPGGVDVGPADAVLPAAEPDQIWVLEQAGSRWQVRRVAVGAAAGDPDGLLPPAVSVPRRATVVGAVSGVLVTARHADRPSEIRLWDPDTGAELEVADDAVVLAAGADRIALAVGTDVRVIGTPVWQDIMTFEGAAGGGVQAASFSPSGRYLALPRTGTSSITVVDIDGLSGSPVATADVGDAAGGPTAWIEDRLLVAAPRSYVVVVDPEDGSTRRVGPVEEAIDRD